MNCRSAGSKSSTGICLEGDAALESGGLSKESDFPSWAAPVAPRTERMIKQLKLIRDNVNSPLSLNGLSPSLAKRRGAQAHRTNQLLAGGDTVEGVDQGLSRRRDG